MHPVAEAILAATKPFGWLDHATLPAYPIFDWLRWLTAVSSALLVLPHLRVAFGRERPEPRDKVLTIRIGIIAFLAMLIPSVLTELEQIGQPLLVWRLPFFILADALGWWYIVRRL